jgi:peptide deformylase
MSKKTKVNTSYKKTFLFYKNKNCGNFITKNGVIRMYVQTQNPILHKKSCEVVFPLNSDLKEKVGQLVNQFLSEKNAAGLAAPQIGIDLSMCVFALNPTDEIRERRKDIIDIAEIPIIALNPNYYPIMEEGMTLDFESCFSVPGMIGMVRRFNAINFSYQNEDGFLITGQYRGFLARIFQHEVDHLKGILFTEIAEEGSLMSLEEFKELSHE